MWRSRQGQSLAHNEGNNFFVKARYNYLRRNFSNFTCNSLLHCYCMYTKQDCRNQRNSDTDLMFVGREGTSKMLCAVDYIFNFICAFNWLQPMKKIVFSIASRATGRLQIKPNVSGDENDIWTPSWIIRFFIIEVLFLVCSLALVSFLNWH